MSKKNATQETHNHIFFQLRPPSLNDVIRQRGVLQSSAARPFNAWKVTMFWTSRRRVAGMMFGVRVFKLVTISLGSMSLAPILDTLLGRPRDSGYI